MKLLGQILLSRELINEEQLESALSAQKVKKELLGKILVNLGYINEEAWLSVLAEQFGLDYINSVSEHINSDEMSGMAPLNFFKKSKIIPYRIENGTLYVATSDPLNTGPIDDLQTLTGKMVIQTLCPEGEITKTIHHLMEESLESPEEVIEDLSSDDVGSLSLDIEETEDLLDLSDEAPIIRLVNKIFYRAVKERASDIHIEPFEAGLKVRFRIDGTLYERLSPPKVYHAPIVSRVKILAGLNIAERRLPQDGRIKIKIAGKDVDIRVSLIPTAYGERLVLRILDRSSVLLGLSDLGMGKDQLMAFTKAISTANGIVLVTGPTGSGKTTTLYAAMEELNSSETNILTVEDPVEYQIPGIGQIPVNTKVGLTFAKGLRSILRQDPDKIMVGEIRDLETAEIAIQASLTGHLVLSTLHTNDAASAVTRLVDMGVESFLVSATLRAVIAQRLVRRICQNCKIKYSPPEELLEELGISKSDRQGVTFYRGAGCDQCSETGYRGRGAIYEILTISEPVRRLIVENEDGYAIKREALKLGMKTMRQEGISKVLEGITTLEELIAVTREVE
ncbi:MAG: type II secretion system ATPase GspE [Proteobacteria bacterium]|nr:type II secretion system ATPase GspE [Pseudomonadota bacterium]